MAICPSKRCTSLDSLSRRKHHRSQSNDGSVNTMLMEDSVSTLSKSEDSSTTRWSILKHTSNETSSANSFSSGTVKSVSFGQVHIHSHRYTLGDNPSVAGGPPVALAWECSESYIFDLDEYEREKPAPRSKDSTLLPRSLRENILRGEGFSRGELKEASEGVKRIKRQRLKSSRDGRVLRQVEKWIKLIKRGKQPIHDIDAS